MAGRFSWAAAEDWEGFKVIGQPAGWPVPALTINALGEKCPRPIIMLAARLREVRIGDLIMVLADDPATRTDIPAWCGLKSHEFIQVADLPGAPGWAFLIRRSY